MNLRVVALSGLLLAGPLSASESVPPVPAAALPEAEGKSMEGIALGESFGAVDARLGLRSILPLVEGEDAKLYRWSEGVDANRADLVNGAQRIRALEIIFENDVVVEIRSSYRSRTRYTRMGPGLIARYGEPFVVRAGAPQLLPGGRHGVAKEAPKTPSEYPPEPRYRSPEVRLKEKPTYLWVEKWVWQWDDRTFVVIGEHHTEDPDSVSQGLHIFHFRLTSRPQR